MLIPDLQKSIAISGIACLVVTLVFLADVRVALLVSFCIVFSIVDVVGALHFMGLSVEPGSAISIVLCVGLAVDFSCHVGHAFVVASAEAVPVKKLEESRVGKKRLDERGHEISKKKQTATNLDEVGVETGNQSSNIGKKIAKGSNGYNIETDSDLSQSIISNQAKASLKENEGDTNADANILQKPTYPTRQEAARYALVGVGPAVFRGGMSTLLALSVLVFAESFSFLVFLKIFATMILVGLWHGLVFLPVALSMVGPEKIRGKMEVELKREVEAELEEKEKGEDGEEEGMESQKAEKEKSKAIEKHDALYSSVRSQRKSSVASFASQSSQDDGLMHLQKMHESLESTFECAVDKEVTTLECVVKDVEKLELSVDGNTTANRVKQLDAADLDLSWAGSFSFNLFFTKHLDLAGEVEYFV